MDSKKTEILVLYHYYHPDDVVSATLFAGLVEGLAERDWNVEVWPGNRGCHDPRVAYPTKPENFNGVTIRRVWRPNFRQHSFLGRILNSIWMQKAWWLRLALTPSLKPDVLVVGTDPIFSVISVPWLKLLRPKAKIVHWCFDLYPEAAIADGIVKEGNRLVKLVKWFMRWGYEKCDLVADIGSCMRVRLLAYRAKKRATLTPWALEEPLELLSFDTHERIELFGDAPLGLLYSGSFGRAHDFYCTLKLARLMRKNAVFTYGVRGSRLEELKHAVTPEDTNLRITDFAPPQKLIARLSAPDIHMVSLRPEWTGVVVPSKFFGALAAGRPVLFEGDENSAIAGWIKEFKVGWVLNADNIGEVGKELFEFSQDINRKNSMFQHCHWVYQTQFSKKTVLDGWERELKGLLKA